LKLARRKENGVLQYDEVGHVPHSKSPADCRRGSGPLEAACGYSGGWDQSGCVPGADFHHVKPANKGRGDFGRKPQGHRPATVTEAAILMAMK